MSILKRTLVFTLILVTLIFSKAYIGPIEIQHVTSGVTHKIDMHRYYKSEKDFTIIADSLIDRDYIVDFDKDKFILNVTIKAEKSGLYDIPLRVVNKFGDKVLDSVLTVFSQKKVKHTFTYKPDKKIEKVSVAGTFNGWNNSKNILTDEDGDGIYKTTMWFSPGIYKYKLVINGSDWITDPSNPNMEKDGYQNSILDIKGDKEKKNIYIYPDKQTEKTVELKFAGRIPKIKKVSVVVQHADGTCSKGKYSIKDDNILIAVSDIDENDRVRVVVSDVDQVLSNVVTFKKSGTKKFDWKDALIYFTFTDRFNNGNKKNDAPIDNDSLAYPANFHGGDWKGITQKIKEGYFDKLGVNVVWLSPLNKNPEKAYKEYLEPYRYYSGYHGYWPVSSTDVEPRYGTFDDLKELIDEAHKRDIKIIVDLVLNHVHKNHEFWQEHPDWFTKLELPDGTRNLRRWDEYSFTTWFEPILPSFDFSKDIVRKKLLENSLWWVEKLDLDGFRLDAVKHIPQYFWYEFREYFRENCKKDLYFVGETFMSRDGIMSFVGPNMLDGQFDFPLYDTIKSVFAFEHGSFQDIESSLSESERVYGNEALMSILLGNHDKSRFMAYADGDLPDPDEPDEEEVGWAKTIKVDNPGNYEKIKLAWTFLLTNTGVPMIYYGDEFGITGAGDPDNRRDMRFGGDLSNNEKDVLAYFSMLSKIREKHPSLRYGTRRKILVKKNQYAYLRTYFEDRVLVVFNRDTKENEITLEVSPEFSDGEYTDLITGKKYKVVDGLLKIKLGTRRAVVISKT